MTDSRDPVVPTADDILARFAGIVGASLRIDSAAVHRDARLDELGAESIDLVEIAMDVENAFSILMPEHTILDVAGDVFGPEAVTTGGTLTPLGSRLLQLRMPEVDPVALAPGTPVADVNRLFLRVDVWVRLIEGIVARSPRTCEACGARLVQGAPTQLRCSACGRVHQLPSGDDLNREWIRGVAAQIAPHA